MRPAWLMLLVLPALGFAQDEPVVFRSDVSLVRVDAQVVDRDNRAITGLRAEDFVLRDNGRQQEIRSFGRENMPIDIVFLIDVSASMRPHVERIANAASRALRVLGDDDRVAVMVFDRATRVRLDFRKGLEQVERELQNLLDEETFNGGTDITRALLSAARYIKRQARPDARRAIVILTDDQTERDRDDDGVSRALLEADTVLSALLAPDAMGTGRPGRRGGGGSWPGSGGSWPGSGGSMGDIIFGRRIPPPIITSGRTRSAGTAEIAQRTGGDSMRVEDASALETTLSRLRNRYALHFYVPEGARPGEERNVEVTLAASALRRYPDAQVRYRRQYLTPSGGAPPTVAARAPEDGDPDPVVTTNRRRPAVNEPQGGAAPSPSPSATTGATPTPASPSSPTTTQSERKGGWRRATPEDYEPAPQQPQTKKP